MRLSADIIGRINTIELSDLYVRRGRSEALRGVTLSFVKGHSYALLGPNGAGKTTLLDVVSGLLRPIHGSVMLNNSISLYAFNASQRSLIRRRHYAYLLQDCILFNSISVLDNILLPVRLAGVNLSENIIDEIIESLRIRNLLDRRPEELSGGEYRRACLAAALVKGSVADVILLDEPTISVERDLVPTINDLIRSVGKGRIVVVATHDFLLAEGMDRIVRLRAGVLEIE